MLRELIDDLEMRLKNGPLIEMNHVRLSIENATEIRVMLAELTTRPSAEAVQAAVEALGDAKYEILEYARGLNVDCVIGKINNAITGLTGVEG